MGNKLIAKHKMCRIAQFGEKHISICRNHMESGFGVGFWCANAFNGDRKRRK